MIFMFNKENYCYKIWNYGDEVLLDEYFVFWLIWCYWNVSKVFFNSENEWLNIEEII